MLRAVGTIKCRETGTKEETPLCLKGHECLTQQQVRRQITVGNELSYVRMGGIPGLLKVGGQIAWAPTHNAREWRDVPLLFGLLGTARESHHS